MDNLEKAKRKDRILRFLESTDNRKGFYEAGKIRFKVFPNNEISLDECKALVRELLNDNIVFVPGNSNEDIGYQNEITDFLENGGYERLEKQNEIRDQTNKKKEELELKKLNWDSKLAKWQVKTFWLFFILAIIGGVCGIISLVLQIAN